MSQTMSNEIQNIHYCTILSAGQWDFLLEGRFSPLRQKCLFRLMNGAVRTRTAYKIKGIDIVLEVGQVAASDVELAEFLDCNRKTVGKLIARFNRLGMLTTRTNNRTSVHSLHFLTGWYVGGVLITNPHYVRPSATAKGQTGDVRTPLSVDLSLENSLCSVPDDSQSETPNADNTGSETAALSSSLCSPMASEHSGIGQDSKNGTLTDNRAGSPKEAQDGTIGGEDNPEHREEDLNGAKRRISNEAPLAWRE